MATTFHENCLWGCLFSAKAIKPCESTWATIKRPKVDVWTIDGARELESTQLLARTEWERGCCISDYVWVFLLQLSCCSCSFRVTLCEWRTEKKFLKNSSIQSSKVEFNWSNRADGQPIPQHASFSQQAWSNYTRTWWLILGEKKSTWLLSFCKQSNWKTPCRHTKLTQLCPHKGS